MLSEEETANSTFIVFGLIGPVLIPTIYHTQGEHTYLHTTTSLVSKLFSTCLIYQVSWQVNPFKGCRGRDHMVIVFTTTYAICAYHH